MCKQHVLIDADVAELYGVETKRINEAVRNNPQKFPYGYIFELEKYAMEALQDVQDSGEQRKNLLHRTGALLSEMVGRNLSTSTTETEIEVNFAVVKIKHKVFRKGDK